jgi:hypothetical protein
VEGLRVPMRASESRAVDQLERAARACRIDFGMIKDFLKLS